MAGTAGRWVGCAGISEGKGEGYLQRGLSLVLIVWTMGCGLVAFIETG